MNKEYFYHYRPQMGRPVTVLGVWDGDILKLSASTCSTEDQFTKRTGRDNAKQRMAICPQMVFHYNPKYSAVGKSRFFIECADAAGELFSNAPYTLLPLE